MKAKIKQSDKNEYINRLQYLAKLKRECYQKGFKEGEEKARGKMIKKLKQKKFTNKEIDKASKNRQHSMIFFNGFLEAAISSLDQSQESEEK